MEEYQAAPEPQTGALREEMDRLRADLRKAQRELRAARFQIERYKSSVQGKDNMSRVLSEEKARRELYLSNLLRVMPEIVLFLNEELDVVMCSESYLRAANMQSYDEIIGTPGIPDRLEYPEEQPREKVEQELFHTMWNKEFLEEEIYFTFVKGTPRRYYKKYTLPIRNRHDEPVGVILLFNDMTDLIASRKNAERASESKSAFLANMSHEIRTPMNAIIGMTNIAKSSDDPAQKDYCLGKIESASTHLLGVINDILDMSKIEANKLSVADEAFDFEKMLFKITNVVGYNMEEKRHTFHVELDPAIPRYLRSDDQRLAQVITNLLSNAVKFTPEGGEITLRAQKIDEADDICTLRFEVRDNGIGISPEQQKRLFRSFEQADSTTSRVFGGTGLGLAISKRIVEMLGGRIWVESKEGEGSSFVFTIRATRVRDIDRASRATDVPHETEAYDFSHCRIMLAEDMEINREIVTTLLQPTGIHIDCAENGRRAVEMFAADPERYDAIFMDIHMPQMDGYEASRAIRGMSLPYAKRVPIIAMTANVFREDVEKCRAAGMNDHLGKPLDIVEVQQKLAQHLLS